MTQQGAAATGQQGTSTNERKRRDRGKERTIERRRETLVVLIHFSLSAAAGGTAQGGAAMQQPGMQPMMYPMQVREEEMTHDAIISPLCSLLFLSPSLFPSHHPLLSISDRSSLQGMMMMPGGQPGMMMQPGMMYPGMQQVTLSASSFVSPSCLKVLFLFA